MRNQSRNRWIGLTALLIVFSISGCSSPDKANRVNGNVIDKSYRPVSSTYLRSLKHVAASPSIIQNIEQANASNKLTQERIDQIDQAWINNTPSAQAAMNSVMGNPTSDFLRKINRLYPEYLELFLIDRKGCVTAANLPTSDYWQGDEAKWQKIINGDHTDYFIDQVELDESVQAYVHHYSMPIKDLNDQLIGVLVVGIAAQ